MVEDSLDPLQLAYRARCGVEDATVTLVNLVLKHLEGTKLDSHFSRETFQLWC